MKPRFDICLGLVLGSEGGYSNDKDDHGGATNGGITQATYDGWRVGRGLGRQPVLGISGDEIRQIYFDLYWTPGRCAALPAPLDYVHFDGCVNHGNGQAAKFLQRALGVAADGVVGPHTLRAVGEDARAGDIGNTIRTILSQREIFYHDIVKRDESQRKFLAGWLNRIAHIRKVVGQ